MLPYTICFIRRADQLLLLERRRAPNLGLWNGVGGKLIPGESALDGILREVLEETGLALTGPSVPRFGGIVTWYEAGNGRRTGGMYAFVASLPEDFQFPTPVVTDEGTLDWKDISWVLDTGNQRVPVSAHHFLQTLLEDSGRCEHRLIFEADHITGCTLLPLPEDRSRKREPSMTCVCPTRSAHVPPSMRR